MSVNIRRTALALAAVPLALLACGPGSGPPAGRTRPPPMVSVAKVIVRDVPVEALAPVDLKPVALADIGAKTVGYLDAVLVDRGDPVKRGQLLAVVRPSDLPDQLTALRGTYAQARAAAALAQANADRARQLAPSGVVSTQELENANAAVEATTAQVAAVQAQMAAVSTRLGETHITSPLDGFVWQRRLDPGALVGQAGSGGVILTVVQVDSLRAFISVSEHQAAAVKVGMSAWVEVDAIPGRRFQGTVVRLSPAFDPGTRTLDAEVRINNTAGELRPGMYGRAGIALDEHKGAIVIPAGALQISNDRCFVFVLDGELVHRRAVETGVDGGDWLEVVKGVAPGDEVVIAGIEGLAEGSKVRVSRDQDPFTGARPAGAPDAGPAGRGKP